MQHFSLFQLPTEQFRAAPYYSVILGGSAAVCRGRAKASDSIISDVAKF